MRTAGLAPATDTMAGGYERPVQHVVERRVRRPRRAQQRVALQVAGADRRPSRERMAERKYDGDPLSRIQRPHADWRRWFRVLDDSEVEVTRAQAGHLLRRIEVEYLRFRAGRLDLKRAEEGLQSLERDGTAPDTDDRQPAVTR
jgi:hypothetical protein